MGECLYQNGKNGITSMTHPDATSYCDPAILTHIQMFHTSLLISLDRSLNHNLGWRRLPCCATQASPKSKGSRPKSIWKTSTDPLTPQSHMTSDTNGPNGPNGPMVSSRAQPQITILSRFPQSLKIHGLFMGRHSRLDLGFQVGSLNSMFGLDKSLGGKPIKR